MSCRRCAHAFITDLATAQALRAQGYRQGMGDFRHDEGCVCVKHRIIASVRGPRCGYQDIGAAASAPTPKSSSLESPPG